MQKISQNSRGGGVKIGIEEKERRRKREEKRKEVKKKKGKIKEGEVRKVVERR
jgi:hypothetical protein